MKAEPKLLVFAPAFSYVRIAFLVFAQCACVCVWMCRHDVLYCVFTFCGEVGRCINGRFLKGGGFAEGIFYVMYVGELLAAG